MLLESIFFVYLMYMCLNHKLMMILLMTMSTMLFLIIFSFYYTMEYWYPFMLILSFLVGLFLIFIYIVSLDTEHMKNSTDNYKNMKMGVMSFFLISLMASFLGQNKNILSADWFVKVEMVNSQFLQWMMENSNEIIFMVLLLFTFFIIFLFFFMKKNKKMMKTSV